MAVFEHFVMANTARELFLADQVRVTTEEIGMERLNAEQKRDTPGRKTSHNVRELTEQELEAVSGGDGPPSTAGDGNGRVSRFLIQTV
jgi:bacteriocin-like protein